jgi:hypothetical protein
VAIGKKPDHRVRVRPVEDFGNPIFGKVTQHGGSRSV